MKVIDLGIACVASVPLRFSGVGVERAKVGTRAKTEQREQAGGGGGRGREGRGEKKRGNSLSSLLPLLRFFPPRPKIHAVKNRKAQKTLTELLTIATQADLGAETFPNHDIV